MAGAACFLTAAGAAATFFLGACSVKRGELVRSRGQAALWGPLGWPACWR